LQIKSIIDNLNFSVGMNSVNDSIATLEIVEAAKKSMKTGRVIVLN